MLKNLFSATIIAMLLCSANQIFAQTTPELREIFTDPILTKLVLEEVGFYEKSPAKAWRVACDGPSGLYQGLWRSDSLEVLADVSWINNNTNDTCWCDDTIVHLDYKPIPAPDLPVTAPDLISSGLTWYEMDSLEFEIDYRQVKQAIESFKDLRPHKSKVIFLVENGEIRNEGFKYCVVESKNKKITYHFYNEYEDGFSWINGFTIDFDNLRVWNAFQPLKTPKFKKIFSDKK